MQITMDCCKGCATYIGAGEYHDCAYAEYNKKGACPCSKCVVKVMCVEPCDEYDEWIQHK